MQPEAELQSLCVSWFNLQHRERMILSIPNGALLGGNRFAIVAILKKTGLLKGAPDLFIPEPTKKYHGLWIEMKTPKGKASPEQLEVMQNLKDRGYYTEICRSFEEFKDTVNKYFKGKI